MNLNVDLGQIIVTAAIAIVGYLISLQISTFRSQLIYHEKLIIGLVSDVQRLIGINIGRKTWDGNERRVGED